MMKNTVLERTRQILESALPMLEARALFHDRLTKKMNRIKKDSTHYFECSDCLTLSTVDTEIIRLVRQRDSGKNIHWPNYVCCFA